MTDKYISIEWKSIPTLYMLNVVCQLRLNITLDCTNFDDYFCTWNPSLNGTDAKDKMRQCFERI